MTPPLLAAAFLWTSCGLDFKKKEKEACLAKAEEGWQWNDVSMKCVLPEEAKKELEAEAQQTNFEDLPGEEAESQSPEDLEMLAGDALKNADAEDWNYLEGDKTRKEKIKKMNRENLEKELEKAAANWLQIAPRCGDKRYPSKNHCDDGDMTLFNGLLCMAGFEEACGAVADAQDENGRFWRSPDRKGDNKGDPHSFSRDMSLGVLAYLVATKDKLAAQKWISWIGDNKKCLYASGQDCGFSLPGALGGAKLFDYPKLPVVCTDEQTVEKDYKGMIEFSLTTPLPRCLITPGLANLMTEVFSYIGVEGAETVNPINFPAPDHADSLAQDLSLDGAKGFEIHLHGVKVLIRQQMGQDQSQTARSVLMKAPGNLFFQHLYGNSGKGMKAQLLSVCPGADDELPGRGHQWTWERDRSEKAWEDSMVWDCLFIRQMYH